MTLKTLCCAIVVALGMASAASMAADYENGKKKAETCVACHGPEGNKPITPDIPILAGQHYEYLMAALRQYQKGERTNPMMMPMAAPLTNKDIKDVSLYFSKQKGLTSKY